jgi:hypothetical protein
VTLGRRELTSGMLAALRLGGCSPGNCPNKQRESLEFLPSAGLHFATMIADGPVGTSAPSFAHLQLCLWSHAKHCQGWLLQ